MQRLHFVQHAFSDNLVSDISYEYVYVIILTGWQPRSA